MSSVPKFTINELIEAGVHFGHKTMRWNPKMSPYIYGVRNGIHIIDLQKTAPILYKTLKLINEVAINNGKILFVGTKRQASEIIAEAAKRCGQYYVNHRWLGGMLTNWETVSKSIKTLKDIQARIESDNDSFKKLTKKEKLELTRAADKLEKSLGGIAEMGGVPDILFVIDTNKEHIAVQEAKRLSIPVIGISDTNSDPEIVDYSIPGNDDATRSIKLYCRLVSDAVLGGIQESLIKSGADLGDKAEGLDNITSRQNKKSVSLKNERISQIEEDEISNDNSEMELALVGETSIEEEAKEVVAKAKKAPAKKASTKSKAKEE